MSNYQRLLKHRERKRRKAIRERVTPRELAPHHWARSLYLLPKPEPEDIPRLTTWLRMRQAEAERAKEFQNRSRWRDSPWG